MGRKSLIPQIEKKYGKSIDQVIIELSGQGKKVPEICKILGVKKSLVYEIFKQFQIKPKQPSAKQSYFDIGGGDFGQVLNDFLMAKEISGKTKGTLEFYRFALGKFQWWLVDQAIPQNLESCFTVEVIRRFLHYVQTTESRFGGKTSAARKMVSRSTVDAYYRALNALGAWLKMEEKILVNPCDRIQKPKQIKTVIPEIPKQVQIEIVNSEPDDLVGRRNKAILLLLIDTGIRLDELHHLDRTHINFETGVMRIFGKGQKERFVRISEFTRKALKSYLVVRDKKSKVKTLWVDKDGREIGRHGIHKIFKNYQARYPDYPLNPHSFRHTWALNFYRKTRDLLSLKALGGWADLKMPEHYAAAITHEDSLKAHEVGSPVEDMFTETRPLVPA